MGKNPCFHMEVPSLPSALMCGGTNTVLSQVLPGSLLTSSEAELDTRMHYRMHGKPLRCLSEAPQTPLESIISFAPGFAESLTKIRSNPKNGHCADGSGFSPVSISYLSPKGCYKPSIILFLLSLCTWMELMRSWVSHHLHGAAALWERLVQEAAESRRGLSCRMNINQVHSRVFCLMPSLKSQTMRAPGNEQLHQGL